MPEAPKVCPSFHLLVVKKGSMLTDAALSPKSQDIDVETIKARTKK